MNWDIFCKVIDNYGDIGVCWRLACNLAARGQQVRLWADDPSALAWMAQKPWPTALEVRNWALLPPRPGIDKPGDVVVEAFGCEIAHEFIAAYAVNIMVSAENEGENVTQIPIWINLEYLSAQAFVARSHGLRSPVMHGPARGMDKWFFYPGFTAGTGGLLREPGLAEQLSKPHKPSTVPLSNPALTISLFCYDNPALSELLQQLADSKHPIKLQVTAGRAQQATEQAINHKNSQNPNWNLRKLLSISYLPALAHPQFDDLLQTSQFNCVRGEDSLVRALWAGQALVWQIYPQDDGAHRDKLEAFLDWLQAPADLRQFHAVWNGFSSTALPRINLQGWAACVGAARQRLLSQPDLSTQLFDFVMEKRLK